MASNRPITVEQSLAEMAKWPDEWRIEVSDVTPGRVIVEALMPFVRHLHESGLSASAIRRHLNELGLLGSELIRDRHRDRPRSAIPPLIKVVDEEGGPLLHNMDETSQRPFDTTCRALHRFLTKPGGKAVVSPRRRRATSSSQAAALDGLIEKAITDAYNDSEQASGFLTCMQDGIAMPFTTEVLGVLVTVTGFDLTEDDSLVACCRRGKATQRIPVLELPLPKPPPAGHEWIAAYRRWRKGAA